jgi:hypothetical protein
MRPVLCAAIAICIASAGAISAQEPQNGATDPRLDQKVTCDAKGQPLHKVLDELTQKTGVVMRCGKSTKDWQVRDRKVTIFVKDFPLGDLQRTLARILHFTWARGTKDGDYTYRIFQDLKSKKEEERLRVETAEAEKKKWADKRESAIAGFEKLASLTPEEIEKLRTNSPQSYPLAKEPIFGAMGRLTQASPEIRQALAERRKLTINLSEASPEMVEAAREFASAYDSLMQRVDPNTERSPGPVEHINDATITINSGIQGLEHGDPLESMFLGIVAIEAEDCETADMPLFDPNGPFGKLVGHLLTRLEQGMPREQFDAEIGPLLEQTGLDLMRGDETPEPLPDDPDLEKAIKIEIGESRSLPDVLEELAKKAELQVVSDHFLHARNRMPPMVKPGDKLGALLQAIALAHGKRVKKSGKLVTFEDRKWFEKRSWEVPEAWIERWSAKAKKETFGLDDLVAVAGLTDEQIQNTVLVDERLGAVAWSAENNKQALRLYAVLTRPQKQALRAPGGLEISTLAPEQQPYFELLLQHTPGAENRPRTPLAMFLVEGQPGKEYKFTLMDLSPPPGEEPTQLLGEWWIYLPGYEPPATPEDEGAAEAPGPTDQEPPQPPGSGPEPSE